MRIILQLSKFYGSAEALRMDSFQVDENEKCRFLTIIVC
jgi:hypothetical protein